MDIADYLRHRGRKVVQSGSHFKAICPFHDETKPSFQIWEDGHAHCFSCERHFSDIVGLIAELEFPHLSGKEMWREAFRRAKELGVKTNEPIVRFPIVPRLAEASSGQKLAMRIAYDHYREQLFETFAGAKYLEGRGYKDLSAIPVGFCPSSSRNYDTLVQKLEAAVGHDWYAIGQSVGVISKRGFQRLRNRIVIPDFAGDEIIYILGRSIDPKDELKYLTPSGIRKPLFGLSTMDWDHDIVALVEGVFDAFPFHSEHFPAVAILGSDFADESQLLKKLKGRPLAVALDNDERGCEAARTIMDRLEGAGARVFRFDPPPDYKDIGEWAQAAGAKAVIKALYATAAIVI